MSCYRIFPDISLALITGMLWIVSSVIVSGEARFLSVYPENSSDAWVAALQVDGNAFKLKEKISFKVDGQELSHEVKAADKGRIDIRFPQILPGARQLVLYIKENKTETAVAAIPLGALDLEKNPFGSWTIYHIMMEMFCNGSAANDSQITGWKHPNYAGGDLQGVLDRLSYIEKLGVTAVWFSPIFAARTSHGYDVTDYYRIGDAVAIPNDIEGSLTLFREFVEKAHAKGIKTILDIPLNHASKAYDDKHGDPDALKPRGTGAKQEAERLWSSWGADYQYWDFTDQNTRLFLTNVAKYWLTNENIDGIRLDYARGVPHDFWVAFYKNIKTVKPTALLMGECWIDAAAQAANTKDIATYYDTTAGQQFDSLLDFPMQITMISVFAKSSNVDSLEEWLQKTLAAYGPSAIPAYFFDNHDLARFMSWNNDQERLKAAVGFLCSLSGPVVLFYGTETGLTHLQPKDGFTDAGRVPMPWNSLNEQLIQKTSEYIRLRNQHPALHSGARFPLYSSKDVLVMAKQVGQETILVGVNLAKTSQKIEIPIGALITTDKQMSSQPVKSVATVSNGVLSWELPPKNTVYLIPE